ncbi:MAG: polyphosphate kinase 1, partial [Shewanella sp.]
WFNNHGKSEIYCSSADWLERNLLRRVETCFPILDKEYAARIFYEELDCYLRDNSQAWQLNSNGSYQKIIPAENETEFCAQDYLLHSLCRKR